MLVCSPRKYSPVSNEACIFHHQDTCRVSLSILFLCAKHGLRVPAPQTTFTSNEMHTHTTCTAWTFLPYKRRLKCAPSVKFISSPAQENLRELEQGLHPPLEFKILHLQAWKKNSRTHPTRPVLSLPAFPLVLWPLQMCKTESCHGESPRDALQVFYTSGDSEGNPFPDFW